MPRLRGAAITPGNAPGGQFIWLGNHSGIWKPDNIALGIEINREIAELTARIETLTRTQIRVLYLLSEGLSNKQIAVICEVTESTVKSTSRRS